MDGIVYSLTRSCIVPYSISGSSQVYCTPLSSDSHHDLREDINIHDVHTLT